MNNSVPSKICSCERLILDKRDFPQSSSLTTPGEAFWTYFDRAFDPRSAERDRSLTSTKGACAICVIYDFKDEIVEQFDEATVVSDPTISSKIEPIRNDMHRALRAFAQIHSDLSRVAYQINPRRDVGQLQTGYESSSPSELKSNYQRLSRALFIASVPVFELRARFYYTIQTGSSDYESQLKALNRKNLACEDFKLH